MRLTVSFIFSLLVHLFCSTSLKAQPAFSATVKPVHITTDEYSTLRFVLKDAGDINKFTPPSLEDFEVVSGPNQETSMSSINGVVTQYTALSYIIKPLKAGRYIIGPASAISGKKLVKSNAVQIIVNKGSGKQNSTPPSSPLSNLFSYNDPAPEPEKSVDLDDYILHNGENIAAKVDRNMALKLETNKNECWVGEPIVASYKFYTRLKSESKLSKNPSFNGFSVIDLLQPDATISSIGRLNGKEYNTYTIRKAQLYALQPGNIMLESATIENEIQFLKEDQARSSSFLRDLRNGFPLSPDALVSQQVSLSSKPVSITVKPLPEIGKPSYFHGAVGDFRIKAELQKNNFTTDETGILKITISGAGNLHLITAPEINFPEGIDAFDPVLEDNLDKMQVPVKGTKVFSYNFSVTRPGTYIIPAVAFAFFDPATATYKTFQTKPQQLTILKGTNINKSQNIIPGKEKKPSAFLQFINDNWVWLLLVPGFLILFVLFIKKRTKTQSYQETTEQTTIVEIDNTTRNIAEATIENQKNPLEESELCLAKNDCDNFYRVLNRELRSYLGTKFNIPPSTISKNNLEQILDKCNVETPVAIELGSLLEEIEWNVYSPVPPGEHLQSIYKRSVDVVQTINEQCQTIDLNARKI